MTETGATRSCGRRWPRSISTRRSRTGTASTKTIELRLGTEDTHGFGWLVGFYGNLLDETLSDLSLGDYQPLGTPVDPVDDQSDNVIDSGYRARNLALFGELDGDLAANLRWSFGLRGERWSANYQGTTTDFLGTNTGYTNAPVTPTAIESVTPAALSPVNNLWGGHASLTYKLDSTQSLYTTVSRGYKAGGFNLSQGLLPNQLSVQSGNGCQRGSGIQGGHARSPAQDQRGRLLSLPARCPNQDQLPKRSVESRRFRFLHRQCSERP